jgi:hypothetical protein
MTVQELIKRLMAYDDEQEVAAVYPSDGNQIAITGVWPSDDEEPVVELALEE